MTSALTTDEALFREMPRFPWRRPIRYVTTTGDDMVACRVCLAIPGRTHNTRDWLFATREGHAAHVRTVHPEAPPDPRRYD